MPGLGGEFVAIAHTENPWGTIVGSTGSPHDYTQAEPSGVQDGDLMIAYLFWCQNGTQSFSIAEGGWTALPMNGATGIPTSGSSSTGRFFYRFKQPGDPSSWTFRNTHSTGAQFLHAGGIVAYRGINVYDVLSGQQGGGSPASHQANNNVPPWTDADTGTLTISSSSRLQPGRALVLAFMIDTGDPHSRSIFTEPVGMTKRLDVSVLGDSYYAIWDQFVDPGASWPSYSLREQFSGAADYAVYFDAFWPGALYDETPPDPVDDDGTGDFDEWWDVLHEANTDRDLLPTGVEELGELTDVNDGVDDVPNRLVLVWDDDAGGWTSIPPSLDGDPGPGGLLFISAIDGDDFIIDGGS